MQQVLGRVRAGVGAAQDRGLACVGGERLLARGVLLAGGVEVADRGTVVRAVQPLVRDPPRNAASSGWDLTASSVPKSCSVSTPLRMVSITCIWGLLAVGCRGSGSGAIRLGAGNRAVTEPVHKMNGYATRRIATEETGRPLGISLELGGRSTSAGPRDPPRPRGDDQEGHDRCVVSDRDVRPGAGEVVPPPAPAACRGGRRRRGGRGRGRRAGCWSGPGLLHDGARVAAEGRSTTMEHHVAPDHRRSPPPPSTATPTTDAGQLGTTAPTTPPPPPAAVTAPPPLATTEAPPDEPSRFGRTVTAHDGDMTLNGSHHHHRPGRPQGDLGAGARHRPHRPARARRPRPHRPDRRPAHRRPRPPRRRRRLARGVRVRPPPRPRGVPGGHGRPLAGRPRWWSRSSWTRRCGSRPSPARTGCRGGLHRRLRRAGAARQHRRHRAGGRPGP